MSSNQEEARLRVAYAEALTVLRRVRDIQEAHEAGTRCLCAVCKIVLPDWLASDEARLDQSPSVLQSECSGDDGFCARHGHH